MNKDTSIIHERDNSQFTLSFDGHSSLLKYRIDGHNIDFYSTFTDPSMRGQGAAARLVQAGLAFARENKLNIRASCWYVAKYLNEHPEVQS